MKKEIIVHTTVDDAQSLDCLKYFQNIWKYPPNKKIDPSEWGTLWVVPDDFKIRVFADVEEEVKRIYKIRSRV